MIINQGQHILSHSFKLSVPLCCHFGTVAEWQRHTKRRYPEWLLPQEIKDSSFPTLSHVSKSCSAGHVIVLFVFFSLNVTSLKWSINGMHILHLFGSALPRDYGRERRTISSHTAIKHDYRARGRTVKVSISSIHTKKNELTAAGERWAQAWITLSTTNRSYLSYGTWSSAPNPVSFSSHVLFNSEPDTSEFFSLCSSVLSLKLSAPTAMEMGNPTGASRPSLTFRTHSAHTKATAFSASC